MTKYTVVWTQGALDELTNLWMAASDRALVTAASDAIDQELAIDAEDRGESVFAQFRFLRMPLLRVLIAVRNDDRLVEVLLVERL